MSRKPTVLFVTGTKEQSEIPTLGEAYDSRSCSSRPEALAILADEPIDVLVVGAELEGDSGTDLLAQASVMSPLSCRIVMTGKADAAFLLNAINIAKVTHCIAKPVSSEELEDAIRGALVARGRSQKALASMLIRERGPSLASETEHGADRVRPEGWPAHLVENLDQDDVERLGIFFASTLSIGVVSMSPKESDVDLSRWSAELELRLVTSLRETDHCFRLAEDRFLVLFGHTSRRGSESAGRRFGSNLEGGLRMQSMQWPDDAQGLDRESFAREVIERLTLKPLNDS